MPINYKDYPANWKTEIRPAILKRANDRCEVCGVINYSYVFRCDDGTWFYAEDWLLVQKNKVGFYRTKGDGRVKIVLTIAHLDHDTKNNDYSNLKAMCQRCHNRYDIAHRKQTRDNKKSLGLFKQ